MTAEERILAQRQPPPPVLQVVKPTYEYHLTLFDKILLGLLGSAIGYVIYLACSRGVRKLAPVTEAIVSMTPVGLPEELEAFADLIPQ